MAVLLLSAQEDGQICGIILGWVDGKYVTVAMDGIAENHFMVNYRHRFTSIFFVRPYNHLAFLVVLVLIVYYP